MLGAVFAWTGPALISVEWTKHTLTGKTHVYTCMQARTQSNNP